MWTMSFRSRKNEVRPALSQNPCWGCHKIRALRKKPHTMKHHQTARVKWSPLILTNRTRTSYNTNLRGIVSIHINPLNSFTKCYFKRNTYLISERGREPGRKCGFFLQKVPLTIGEPSFGLLHLAALSWLSTGTSRYEAWCLNISWFVKWFDPGNVWNESHVTLQKWGVLYITLPIFVCLLKTMIFFARFLPL